jgi:hypothetical protein
MRGKPLANRARAGSVERQLYLSYLSRPMLKRPVAPVHAALQDDVPSKD